jgi:hypothetical protein
MIVLFLIFLVPMFFWMVVEERWHLYLGIFYATVAVICAAFFVRRVRREKAEQRAQWPLHDDYRWRKAWPAARFRQHLCLYLQLRGWTTVSAEELGTERLVLVTQRDRWKVALLCVRPGHAPVPQDGAHLDSVRVSAGATRAALVSASRADLAVINGRDLIRLRFEDLEMLDDTLRVHV